MPQTQAEREYNDLKFNLNMIDGQLDGIEEYLDHVKGIDPTGPRKETQELRKALSELESDLSGQAQAAYEQAKKEAEEKAAQDKAEKEAERDEWAAQHPGKDGEKAETSASPEAEKKAA